MKENTEYIKKEDTEMDISKFSKKYEMHLHTSEASLCGANTGEEMVRAHKEAGYSGIFVTNHAWGGNTSVDRSLPYDKWVYEFAKGYDNARNEGEKLGLQVFFGMEAGFNGTEFLLYGITPEWLARQNRLWEATVEEQFYIIHEGGGIVVHAHPYREEWYIPEIRLYPEYVDAVETVNATHSSHLSTSHNDPKFDDRAIEYARKHNLPQVAGSDVHRTLVLGGGICFDHVVRDEKEIIAAILGEEQYLLTNGDSYYDRQGNKLK